MLRVALACQFWGEMPMKIDFDTLLTPDQRDLMIRSIQRADCAKGQIVHRHGDACVGVIRVRKGNLRFSVISEEGREITLFQAEPGDCCILSAACVLHSLDLESQVIAETAAVADILPAPVLAQLMAENKDLEREIFRKATVQYALALRTMERIVFFSLEKRLALFLKEESLRRSAMSFRVTHEGIARCIGSSREVVTRMLNQFAVRGIVSLGRGTVTVTDREALDRVLA